MLTLSSLCKEGAHNASSAGTLEKSSRSSVAIKRIGKSFGTLLPTTSPTSLSHIHCMVFTFPLPLSHHSPALAMTSNNQGKCNIFSDTQALSPLQNPFFRRSQEYAFGASIPFPARFPPTPLQILLALTLRGYAPLLLHLSRKQQVYVPLQAMGIELQVRGKDEESIFWQKFNSRMSNLLTAALLSSPERFLTRGRKLFQDSWQQVVTNRYASILRDDTLCTNLKESLCCRFILKAQATVQQGMWSKISSTASALQIYCNFPRQTPLRWNPFVFR